VLLGTIIELKSGIGKVGEWNCQSCWKTNVKKTKNKFLNENSMFIRLRRKMKSAVLFFDERTIHFYRIIIKV